MPIEGVDKLPQAERDQHADHDDQYFVQELTPAVKGTRFVTFHPRFPLTSSSEIR